MRAIFDRYANGWNASVLVVLVVMFSGCATAPPVEAPATPRAEEEKSNFTVRDNVDVDDDMRADFDTALAHLTAGQYQKGIELLHRLTQKSPRHMAPYINLAIAYQKMGNLPAAEENIKKAVALNPEHPVANTEYGLIYRKTGRFPEARQSYERTLKRHPGFLPARKNLGILCDVYLRDWECALTHYRVYSAAMPEEKGVRIWIADLEKRLGKQEQ